VDLAAWYTEQTRQSARKIFEKNLLNPVCMAPCRKPKTKGKGPREKLVYRATGRKHEQTDGKTREGGQTDMVYVLIGEDASRMEYKLERIKKEENCDQIDRFNCAKDDPAEINNELVTMNLFAEKPMVILTNATFLGAKNTTPFKPEEILANIPDDKVVVMMAEIKKMDTRKKVIKNLQNTAKVLDCMPLDEKNQPGEIQQMIKERKLKMDRDAFEWFCANAGYSQPVLAGQLDKLALYSDHLTLADVKALTTVEPTHNVFKMTDALFRKDRVKLLELYRTFRGQNMEPQAILGLLAGQIRFVYQVRVLMDSGCKKEEIMDILKASSGRIWNTMKNANRFRADQLLDNLALLSNLDETIKSGRMDRDTAFENFILQIQDPSSR